MVALSAERCQPDVSELLHRLQLLVGERQVGGYIESIAGSALRAAVLPQICPSPTDGFSLAFRFASWLKTLTESGVIPVPEYLKPWLPFPKVLAVPLVAGERHMGALVVDPLGLRRSSLLAIEALAAEAAADLDAVERWWEAETDTQQGPMSASARRLKAMVTIHEE